MTASLQPVVAAITALTKKNINTHPLRSDLKRPQLVLPQAASDALREHFHSGTGLMRQDSGLRDWYGDEALLPAEVWEFVTVQAPRPLRRKSNRIVGGAALDLDDV